MNKDFKTKKYIIKKNNFIRIINSDICRFGLKKHHYKILSEIDVTNILVYIKKQKKLGIDISITALFIKLISKAIEKNKMVHGFLIGRTRLKIFNDIDFEIEIEKKINNENIPYGIIIKETNKKNITDITKEIRTAQNNNLEIDKFIKIFCYLPFFIRYIIWKILLKNTNLIKKYFGTVFITSLGMIKDFNGWIIPISIQQLCIGIGSIFERDRKKYIKLTFLFDHDIIDGGDAVRFISDFDENIKTFKLIL